MSFLIMSEANKSPGYAWENKKGCADVSVNVVKEWRGSVGFAELADAP